MQIFLRGGGREGRRKGRTVTLCISLLSIVAGFKSCKVFQMDEVLDEFRGLS